MISGGTTCPFIDGNVLYAKPARIPATKPPVAPDVYQIPLGTKTKRACALSRVARAFGQRQREASLRDEGARPDSRSAGTARSADEPLLPAELCDPPRTKMPASCTCPKIFGAPETTKRHKTAPTSDPAAMDYSHRRCAWSSSAIPDTCCYSRLVPRSRRPIGLRHRQRAEIGCHSVIDRPECVSRVTPPTTTIAKTSAQHASSQYAIARDAPVCANGRAREPAGSVVAIAQLSHAARNGTEARMPAPPA